MIVTPPIPPPDPYRNGFGWLLGFSATRRWLRRLRAHEVAELNDQFEDVAGRFIAHLDSSFDKLEWKNPVPIDQIPYSISEEGLLRLDDNVRLTSAVEDFELVRSGELTSATFHELHGFNHSELFDRRLEYLKSVAPETVTVCDSAECHEFEDGWCLILGRLDDLPIVACLGIAADPIDAFYPEDFSMLKFTRPIWARMEE